MRISLSYSQVPNRVLKRRSPLAIALAALALSVTACSSSGGTAATTGSPATPQSTTTQPSLQPSDSGNGSGPAALVPASIRSKGTLVVALDATTPPVEFIAPDGHTIIGLQADLITAVGKELNLKLKLINAKFETIIPGLVDGKYDIGQAGYFATAAREKQVDMVSYEYGGTTLYVKAGSGKSYSGPESLCGAKLAVQLGSSEDTSAQQQSQKCTSEGKPAIDILRYATGSEENLAVQSGRADVGWDDAATIGYLVKNSNGVVELAGTLMKAPSPSCIALPKGNGMAKPVQAAVNALISNGEYASIFAKWGMSDTMVTLSEINPKTAL